jgi:multidrug efflux pump subunit AcrB
VFIESAIEGVYLALFEAVGLVVLVIYLILGSFRATLVPAVAVPVSLVATFIVLLAVFAPITFHEGDVGRLFSEFAAAISALA